MKAWKKHLVAPMALIVLACGSMAFAGAICGSSCEEEPAATVDASKAPATAPASQPAPQAATNTKCPVSGDPIDPAITLVYNGKTIAFCCKDCVADFNKNPQKYAANLK